MPTLTAYLDCSLTKILFHSVSIINPTKMASRPNRELNKYEFEKVTGLRVEENDWHGFFRRFEVRYLPDLGKKAFVFIGDGIPSSVLFCLRQLTRA